MARRQASKTWGGETRAADGCIATFRLPDGSIHVEQFTQQTFSRGSHYQRVHTKDGTNYITQAAARADELGATIISLSTPTTILRDLHGTRAQQKQGSDAAEVQLPEMSMLSKINRLDLLEPRTRPSRVGRVF
jgi:hypothetical protein